MQKFLLWHVKKKNSLWNLHWLLPIDNQLNLVGEWPETSISSQPPVCLYCLIIIQNVPCYFFYLRQQQMIISIIDLICLLYYFLDKLISHLVYKKTKTKNSETCLSEYLRAQKAACSQICEASYFCHFCLKIDLNKYSIIRIV